MQRVLDENKHGKAKPAIIEEEKKGAVESASQDKQKKVMDVDEIIRTLRSHLNPPKEFKEMYLLIEKQQDSFLTQHKALLGALNESEINQFNKLRFEELSNLLKLLDKELTLDPFNTYAFQTKTLLQEICNVLIVPKPVAAKEKEDLNSKSVLNELDQMKLNDEASFDILNDALSKHGDNFMIIGQKDDQARAILVNIHEHIGICVEHLIGSVPENEDERQQKQRLLNKLKEIDKKLNAIFVDVFAKTREALASGRLLSQLSMLGTGYGASSSVVAVRPVGYELSGLANLDLEEQEQRL